MEREPWSSVVGNLIGLLVLAIVVGLILLVWSGTDGYAVQFR